MATELRSLEQNKRLWATLGDIAKQVPWVVNGRQVMLSKDDWKTILSASLKREQRIAAGIDGGWVMLGARTSHMSKSELSDLLDLAYAFGAQHKVVFTDPETRSYEDMAA